LFGGHWSSQCGSAIAPTLRVQEDRLSFDGDGRQLAGTDPQASRSYFGQNPPRDHQAVLIGQGPNSAELLFIVTGVGKNAFIKVDGSQAVRSALGPRWLAERFRHCEGAVGVAKAGEPITRSVRGGQDTGQSAAVLISQPRFKAAWRQALGPQARERWLATMDGPAPPPRWIDIGGTRYVLNTFCRAHHCDEASAVQLYDPDVGLVHGLVRQGDRQRLVGKPPALVAAALPRLWKSEWGTPGR